MRPILRELHVADNASAWRAVGFTVGGSRSRIGTTTLVFADCDDADGLIGWSLEGEPPGNIDGIPTSIAGEAPAGKGPLVHPNGSTSVDHVVVVTPDLSRTIEALAASGFDLRRTRDVPSNGKAQRQAFYRMGETILEVVGPTAPTGDGPATLWGLVTVVDDLGATGLGPLLGEPRDAVQPGRRIATVSRAAGLAVPLAFLTPHLGKGA